MDDGHNSSSSMNRRTASKRPSSDNMTELQRSRSPSLFTQLSTVYDPHYHNEHRARRARLRLPPLDPRNRYAGDGYDFRRPIMAPIEADRLEDARRDGRPETIDLTREAEAENVRSNPVTRTQRLPRYGRDIIDISSSDDEAQPQRPDSRSARPRSRTSLPSLDLSREADSPLFVQQDDEIEFLQSRPLSRLTSRNTSVMPGAADARREESLLIDLTEDDDVTLLETRSVSSINRHNPTISGRAGVRDADNTSALGAGISAYFQGARLNGGRLHDRFNAHYDAFTRLPANLERVTSRLFEYLPRRQELGANREHIRRPDLTGAQARPGGMNLIMDYGMPAFDLGTGAHHAPHPPRYEAPDPPADGFTRSPAEDEEVVCPNCGSELAVGEQEAQRQVWVVKQCGHAYCGTCVQARLATKKGARDKGKRRADAAPILKKCVIEGCGKPVSKSAMIHVFLNG